MYHRGSSISVAQMPSTPGCSSRNATAPARSVPAVITTSSSVTMTYGVVTAAMAALRPTATPELKGSASTVVRPSGAAIGSGESSASTIRPVKARRVVRTKRRAVAGRRKVLAVTVSRCASQSSRSGSRRARSRSAPATMPSWPRTTSRWVTRSGAPYGVIISRLTRSTRLMPRP